MSKPRYLCIHGHFYQPPRDNPWLEAIERQDSAYPYHDWNERITAECYGANGMSRILDDHGRITEIVNNYDRISFNFGPTLLHWMEDHAPHVYQSVLDADARSMERYGGHGSALAQGFNHMIMPLSNDRDRRTQVLWGIRDFEHRFGRFPEGMWLPETAADTPSLEALAEQGIAFTILAPNQAARVRPIGAGDDEWVDVTGSRVDPTRPYLCRLPSGAEITLFFYDGPLSRAVAFEGLLKSGDRFAGRLLDVFDSGRDWPQIGHIATDGETYGHHHRNGDMALARALRVIDNRPNVQLINYGQYLELHPPTHEVEIVEDTSWSCAHGVDRWRANCGCATGGDPKWNQEWRRPLRDALDWLRDELAPRYEEAARAHFDDPWAARDDYIEVILDREPEVIEAFLTRHGPGRDPSPEERVRIHKLLEMQRHAMLMYTSCGWFFDELSGIETVQVIQYAGRVIQLAEELLGAGIEAGFLDRLEKATSNLPQWGSGRQIYERTVGGARVDLTEVGAHFAISSMFGDTAEQTREYCYDIAVDDDEVLEAGRARLATGRLSVTSRVTKEVAELSYGVVHLGDHTIQAGVRPLEEPESFQAMRSELSKPFEAAEFTDTIRALDRQFPGEAYSLRSLFSDQRRQVLDHIIESTLRDAENAYRQIYERNAPLMRFLRELSIPMPAALSLAGEFVLNTSLIREIGTPTPDLDRIETLLQEAERREILLDTEGIAFAIKGALERLASELMSNPDHLELLALVERGTRLAVAAPMDVDLWQLQNTVHDLRRDHSGTVRARADAGSEEAREWLDLFRSLAEAVGVAFR